MPIYYEPLETYCSLSALNEDYPFVLTTNKSVYYRHSGGRQIPSLRSNHPDPVTNINSNTAKKLGINNGDWIYIETMLGRIKQKEIVSFYIDPRLVIADYGWWFPENSIQDIYSWDRSNVNILNDNKPPFNPEMGSANLRGIACNICKACD